MSHSTAPSAQDLRLQKLKEWKEQKAALKAPKKPLGESKLGQLKPSSSKTAAKPAKTGAPSAAKPAGKGTAAKAAVSTGTSATGQGAVPAKSRTAGPKKPAGTSSEKLVESRQKLAPDTALEANRESSSLGSASEAIASRVWSHAADAKGNIGSVTGPGSSASVDTASKPKAAAVVKDEFKSESLESDVFSEKTVPGPNHALFDLELFAKDNARKEVHRAIAALMDASSDTFTSQDGTVFQLDHTIPQKSVDFWLTWARLEEEWCDFLAVADVFGDAGDVLVSQQDIMKIREAYQLFQIRMGQEYQISDMAAHSKEEHYLMEQEEPVLTSKYLEHSTPVIEEDDSVVLLPKHERIDKDEPMGKSTIDLVHLLEDLSLDHPKVKTEPPATKAECAALAVSMSPPKKTTIHSVKVGVPVGEEASHVTVLTPVRASRRVQSGLCRVANKSELGVAQVITPVRRSLRFHDDQDYVTKNKGAASAETLVDASAREGEAPLASTKEKVKDLLREHDFAFVPNQVWHLVHQPM
ncbi:hypothetical protein HDU91_001540 [Kappamyces sp. JEL0680]|nr:hypothetical protein HDU91_001540 [Kappamyces sp. JEL0680]